MLKESAAAEGQQEEEELSLIIELDDWLTTILLYYTNLDLTFSLPARFELFLGMYRAFQIKFSGMYRTIKINFKLIMKKAKASDSTECTEVSTHDMTIEPPDKYRDSLSLFPPSHASI